jgi:DNA-binding transcriptional regulator YhcF (GntR family)
VDFRNERAIWLQIADHVGDGILEAKWKEGDRVPSVRELAVSLEVNPNTVVRSYAWLEERGLIENRRGVGYYVAAGAREAALAVRRDRFDHELSPAFFREMDLLSRTLEDVAHLYEDYRKSGGVKE